MRDTPLASDRLPRLFPEPVAPLPFAVPSARLTRRAVVGVGVLGSGLVTLQWLTMLGPISTPLVFHAVVLAPTCILIGVLLSLATHPGPSPASRVRGNARMLLGLPLGALNGALIVAGIGVAEGPTRELGAVGVAAAVFGAMVAVPYTVALMPLVDRWLVLRVSKAHDAADRMRLWSGAWLALVGAGCAALDSDRVSLGSPLAVLATTVLPGVTGLAVGLVLVARGWLRLFRRQSWLGAVRAGRVSGWAVLPALRCPGVDGDAAMSHLGRFIEVSSHDAGEAPSILARVSVRGEGYREGEQAVPVALVAR